MPNTYSQIYLQFVFAVKGRRSLIPRAHKEDIHKYITGITQNRKAKMLAVNCMPDHTHLFVGFRPVIAISDFMRDIKTGSNAFINHQKWMREKFSWQEGFGVFSYSHSHIDRVIKYVLNQESHHQKINFRQEYQDFLRDNEISYDEKYLFDFMD